MIEEENLEGMTVNERLFLHGLLDEFDRARSQLDLVRLKAIMSEIGLEDYDVGQLF